MNITVSENNILFSVIITTYNRLDALKLTLDAFCRQTIDASLYEIIVVDDGSNDNTFDFVSRLVMPCRFICLRQDINSGISAARNKAISHAAGFYLVLVSDDLIVPQQFLTTHLDTLTRFPGCWVVGGITQLTSITNTPFGRYLDFLEKYWEQSRKIRLIEPYIYELSWPTARNLSLPRAEFLRFGGFDEQFKMSCEDQDLAEKTRSSGIRFLYNSNITCLHNDQVGDLSRYCRAQVPRMRDTVLFCIKWGGFHLKSPVAILNGPITLSDSPLMIARKIIKVTLSTSILTAFIHRITSFCEMIRLPDFALWKFYNILVGIYMYRGWQDGLAMISKQKKCDALFFFFYSCPYLFYYFDYYF